MQQNINAGTGAAWRRLTDVSDYVITSWQRVCARVILSWGMFCWKECEWVGAQEDPASLLGVECCRVIHPSSYLFVNFLSGVALINEFTFIQLRKIWLRASPLRDRWSQVTDSLDYGLWPSSCFRVSGDLFWGLKCIKYHGNLIIVSWLFDFVGNFYLKKKKIENALTFCDIRFVFDPVIMMKTKTRAKTDIVVQKQRFNG